jgi:gliding motility-associated-like protein
MKPQLTLVALFLLLFGTLTAQVKFKVKLLSDNVTYQVLFKPETSWSNPLSTTTAGQVTLRVPTGGFAPGAITNIKGVWKLINTVTSPQEAPGFVYYIYGLDSPIAGSQITYTNGVEIPMFSFKNTGSCTGPMTIINNSTDPFLEPNSQSLGIKNYLTVLGAGQGVNAYIGNYTSFDADCTPISDCGIEVFDVALVSPSACGLADGSISIDAVNSNGFNMQYTVTYGTPQVIWQNSPVFSNLAAGNTFYVAVRDVLGLCIVDVGQFVLQGPLAAIIQSVDKVNPDCGGTNGSIKINAISANGGTLQYAMNQNGPWQSSSTFSGLAEGTYSFFVRDITNNCSNPVGTYTLIGCVPPTCILTYDMNDLGNGKYEVTMITDTTWNAPLNTTSNLQVTLKVPTGGFEAANVVDQTPGVNFAISEIITAPIEDPAHDYITFSLQNPTQNLPYVDGNTVHLFTFENIGTCTGDSIRFMADDDPFMQPNSQNSTAGQYISVLGYGSADAPICLAKSAVICDAVPPAPPSCLVTYEIEKVGDVFQVSIISDTTWNAPFNATSSAQVVVKVPTGGFVVGSLTDLEGDWEVGSFDVAPVEEPNSDYISFVLANPTNLNVFQAGVKTPIFSFKNDGDCQGGQVYLMENNDPFLPPNSLNSNVSQYIAPLGSQGEPINICLNSLPADDCTDDPCAALVPGFTAPDACEATVMAFTNTTTSTETVTSWSWDFGDNSTIATGQSPSHTYSSSGNFEVSLTVTTQSGCNATFMDFVTVFPSPGDAPVSSYNICDGLAVTMETPDNITSATWSPTTGLDLTDPFNPIASPSTTTTYTLTATNSYGCVNTSQVTVNLVNKPVLGNVTVTPISDCNKSDASIQITASGVGSVEYGLDSGAGIVWQAANTFSNLIPGTYNVYVRNADGSCPAAYGNNPITIASPIAPAITSVVSVQPNGCANDGSITINATGGTAPLRYSIGGPFQSSNVFNNLGAGNYNIVVTNADGTCATTDAPVVFIQPTPPTIATPIANQNICVGSSANISIQLSTAINSYNIGGTGAHSGEAVNGNTLNFVAPVNAAGASTYSVTLSEANGCSATSSFTITGVTVPTATFTVSPVICTNGDVVLSNTGNNPNAVLTWSLAGAQVISASTQNSTSPDSATMVVRWATTGSKTLNLSVNNSGCIVTSTQTITVSNFNPGATTTVSNASCGLPNGAINLSVTGSGYTYAWSNGNTNEDITGIASGSYTVTITESTSQCKTTASATVVGTPEVSINNVSTVPATSCTGGNGDGKITATISGGTSPFTYALSGQTPVSGALTSVTFNNLAAGSYTLTVSDAVGCSKVQTVVVNSLTSQLSVAVNAVNAGCTTDNGSFTATVSGGTAAYTYSLYEDNQPAGSNLPVTGSTVTLNGLAPGAYLVIFEDANGCIAAGSGTVARMAGIFPATNVVTPASCGSNNGAIQLNGMPAGATLAWSAGGSANPLSTLAAGVYTATITESNGCISTSTFVVNTTGGQDVGIDIIDEASCGQANGAITFTVTGGGSYSYHILGTNLTGFGTPDNPETIVDVAEGAFVLEVTDLVQSACKVYEVVMVPGSDALQTNSTVQLATGCGNQNGEICIEITGGEMPYAVIASDGTIQPGNAPNKFCVKGLYEGMVQVTITDDNGCEKIFSQDMGQFDEPNITLDSVEIVNPICPDGKGTIKSLSASQYQIFNAGNSQVGVTPWTEASPGTYKLMLSQNGCVDSLNVTVSGPAAWNVTSVIEPKGCGTLGSIALTLGGATGPYTVNWSNNATTTAIVDLPVGIYTATVTDIKNCQFISDYVVADSCIADPCQGEELFYINVYSQQLTSSLTEICLPTLETNLSQYNLMLNGEAYNRTIGDCGTITNFYDGFDVLPVLGPYTLVEWKHGSQVATIPQFFDLEQLVTQMNIFDGAGNWVLDGGTIFGGDATKTYGNMKVRHVTSGFSLDLPPSKLTVPHPTVLVDNHSQVHVLISESPEGCLDTLYINLLQPDPPTKDTIVVTVAEGATQTVCIPVDELYGTLEFLSNACISFTNNAQINSTTENCVEVVGLDEGIDEACIVICDDMGVCDTTILLINVTDGGNDIEIYNAFSPNEDGINDYFKIKNIEKYPNNELVIFNRWGKSVYNVKGYKNTWNAFYRNQRLTDGSYFYILNVEVDGVTKEYKGFVEVRR